VRRTTLISLVLLIVLGASVSGDETVVSSLPAERQGDTVTVSFPYSRFISSSDSSALVAGEEIAVFCRLEVWQKRRLWFDRLRFSYTNYASLGYDRWDEKFVLILQGDEGWEITRRFTALAELLDYLSRHAVFRIRFEPIDHNRKTFVAYEVNIEYLAYERLAEIREWLLAGDESSSSGKSLPDKALNYIVKSAGLKNRSTLETSRIFYPAALRDEIKF
jgi:hypothetical protein